MKRTPFFFAALLLLWLLGSGAGAQEFSADPVNESAEIRVQINDSWLSSDISAVSTRKPLELSNRYGTVFSVEQQIDRLSGLQSVTISPPQASGSRTSGSRGTWILYRRLSDGMPDHIKIFPVQDPSIFIMLQPDSGNPEKGKTLLALNIYGGEACRDIPLGVPFIRMYTATLESIISMTPRLVPWHLINPDSIDYLSSEAAIRAIRAQIGTLVYLDDGAFNENGEPVLIQGGSLQDTQSILKAVEPNQDLSNIIGGVNCSGFVKWLVDGIILPRAGSRLFIEPLKTRTDSPETHFTEPFRENRDLFFALDWTRNLASAVVSLTSARTVKPDESGVDVTINPFANLNRYEKNVGYRTGDLFPILYFLAVTEPGHFYLGAVSRERGTPLLRQYHHAAAFFPYFEEGIFKVDVFESAEETPAPVFLERNTGSYSHLVRVRLPEAGYYQP